MRLRVREKSIALFSIVVYIVLSTVFEESKIGLSKLSSIGLLICMSCCCLTILRNRYFKYNWLIISLFIFGVCLAISALYSPASSSLKNMYLYRYFTSVILIWMIINIVETKQDIRIVLHGYILSGIILALYMYAYYGIRTLLVYGERLGGELGNQNSIGITCASAIIFSIIYLSYNHDRTRWLYLLPIVICLPACLFTGSRKSILLIALCILIYFLSQNREKGQTQRVLFLVLFLIVIWYTIVNIPAFSVIYERFDSLLSLFGRNNMQLDTGSENRVRYITEGWKAFLESPMWGNGFCYSYYKWGVYSHNNYVELLMNNGLIGFLLYYSIHLRLIFHAYKINKHVKNSRDIYSKIYIVIMTIILFMDIGSVNYYTRYTLILLAVCSVIKSQYYLEVDSE